MIDSHQFTANREDSKRQLDISAPLAAECTEHVDPHHLPAEFWNARPTLQHIRQGALARSACPDAVLHSVLARVSAYGSHGLTLPPTIGGRVALNYYVAICGPPSAGKSIVNSVADELWPDDYCLDCAHRSLGSGQSVAAAYFEPHTEGKRQVWTQMRHNALFYADEGELMNTLAAQRDSILGPVLRAASMGYDCGTSGVKSETSRHLKAMSYRLGLIANFQPKHAAALFADADAGLPQRFAWVLATYPRQSAERPKWPGAIPGLGLEMAQGDFTLPPEVTAEIIAEHEAIQAGEKVVELMDAHATLLRLKMAALLAQLEKRRNVTLEDWWLAGMMLDASRAARADMERAALEAKYAAEDEATGVAIRRSDTIKAYDAERPFMIAALASQLVANAAAGGPFQWGGREGLRRTLSKAQRSLYVAAMVSACEQEHLEQYEHEGNTWLRLKAVE